MQLTKINGKYELFLPPARAARPEWDIKTGGWEKARIDEMVNLIHKSDTLFYIGAEVGDIAAIIVKYTGCKIVLFEPNEIVLPCIKSIWEENKLPTPLDLYNGFVSDTTNNNTMRPTFHFSNITGSIISDHGFKQLYESPEIPRTTLDDYCDHYGIFPTVISADIEGSEYSMLMGAEQVLRKYHPTIFLSVHPVFMWEHYKHETGVMLEYMKELGYSWKCIDYAVHEHHLIFTHE